MSDLLSLPDTERVYADHVTLKGNMEPEKDLCSPLVLEALRAAVNADGGEPHPGWKDISNVIRAGVRGGEIALPGHPRILKTIKGMGTVIDWRGSPWSAPNGGRIRARLGVQHIPVIHNVNGFGDLVTLNEVLTAQGLRVQHGTDREGNVALYCDGNRLCFQARGANMVSWGTEHMHFDVREEWSKKQLRASAWIIQLEKRHVSTGRGRASLAPGDGVVRIIRGGQTTHKRVSDCAGFRDRSDPNGTVDAGGHWPEHYDFEYVDHAITFFERHGHFEGA